ncbi:DNA-protecting protein DprA [Clostridium sp. 19966]|uniref:DNA-processing protein DprA n=1 Tax=Clostridium sp. 19966 TaxID=2768166 RepID=UPI0028DEC840|nr:DNA-processing protein DprA [Clostridium sp. 19966]MDT8716435.1 DNA-protecting protein DprA [Clostridium sp. 19966]
MNLYDLWFGNISISNSIKKKLIENYINAQNIYEFLLKNDAMYEDKVFKIMRQHTNMIEIEKLYDKIQEKGIKLLCYTDEEYPMTLKQLMDPPYIIYYYGNLDKLSTNKNVAIVGSRKCTNYGIDATRYISRELAQLGVNIISGMAKGIDGIAHKTCLENGGNTVAVLGSGIDVIYPYQNRGLYESIKEKGCIISEFTLKTPPYAGNFPARNRIISALSDAVVVVEASEKSGSLITASIALDMGKDVLAVPGSIFSTQSIGCNKILKDGGAPFCSIDDLLELLNLNKTGNNNFKNNIIKGDVKKIYSVLTDTPMHIDDIIRITNIDIKLLYALLLEMQLGNVIRCISGCYYVRINDL